MYNKLFIMISLITDFFTKNKKIILFSGLFLFLFYLFGDSAFAAEPWFTEKDWSTLTKEWHADVIRALNWVSTFITVFLSLLTYLTTVFLSPEWINGSVFWLNSYFKTIWIMISNFVYLIFAFILIWIAFMNIIWKWGDKYQLKQALPKLVIWILIVPLSWFIVQFILSLSAVLTIWALNLPFETFSNFDSKLSSVSIPKWCTLNLKDWGKSEDGKNSYFYCDDKWTSTLDEVMNSWVSSDAIFWILWTYTYWLLNLENIAKLSESDQSKIKTIFDLVIKVVFDLLFVIVYSILMIALWLVLMVRWIYIWIYMMISPVFWLMYFFDKTEWWWEFFDKFNIKQFIWLALVPVYAMLALTFWMLFLFIVWEWMTVSNSAWISWIKIVDSTEGSTITIWWKESNWDTKWWYSLEVIWSAASISSITNFTENVWNGALWVVWILILKIFGIVVLWGAVMASLRSNDITKAVVEPLHAFGGQVWWLVTKSPQYLPIFGGQSMESLKQIWASASSHYQNKARKPGEDFMSKHKLFWQTAQNESAAAAAESIIKAKWVTEESVKKFSEAFHWYDTSDKASWSQSMVNAAQALAIKLNIDKSKYEWIKWDRDKFSILMWHIDDKLDREKGWTYWTLLKWTYTVSDANQLNWTRMNSYLADNKEKENSPISENSTKVTNNINISWIPSFDISSHLNQSSDWKKVEWLYDDSASTIAWYVKQSDIATIDRSAFIWNVIKELERIYWSNLDNKWSAIANEIADAIVDSWKKFK